MKRLRTRKYVEAAVTKDVNRAGIDITLEEREALIDYTLWEVNQSIINGAVATTDPHLKKGRKIYKRIQAAIINAE